MIPYDGLFPPVRGLSITLHLSAAAPSSLLWPHVSNRLPSASRALHRLDAPISSGDNCKGQGSMRGSVAHQNDLANTPSCVEVQDGARRVQAAAARRPFGSAGCSHVSVW